MRRGLASRRAWSCSAALTVALAGTCGGQFLTPDTSLAVPPPGHARVELEYSLYRAGAFVAANGDSLDFPGHVNLGLGVLRASLAVAGRVAAGVELPYRWARFPETDNAPALSAHGSPGAGVFVDWQLRAGADSGLVPTLRLEYIRARRVTSRFPTVSDGFDRYLAAVELAPGRGTLPAQWFRGGRLVLTYSPPVGSWYRQYGAQLLVEAGPSLLRSERAALRLLGVAGYRTSTWATQDGVLFHDRTSQGAIAGLRLDWAPAPAAAGPPAVRLSVLKDVRPINALSGWRATVSLDTVL